MIDPNTLVEIGSSLQQLGNWLQRTYPRISCDGAQDGEDLIATKLLSDSPGTYVDVGASHPIECSNTWRFYERGWHGLLIEPLRDAWPAILRYRPRDTLWPQAVSNYTGHARLRICGTVSSLRADWNIPEQATSIVEVDTLANILGIFPDIRDNCRLCSIDVEGHERQVLEGIDWDTFHPAVFIIEWNRYVPREGESADLSEEWRPILDAHGYEDYYKTTTNVIFRRAQ